MVSPEGQEAWEMGDQNNHRQVDELFPDLGEPLGRVESLLRQVAFGHASEAALDGVLTSEWLGPILTTPRDDLGNLPPLISMLLSVIEEDQTGRVPTIPQSVARLTIAAMMDARHEPKVTPAADKVISEIVAVFEPRSEQPEEVREDITDVELHKSGVSIRDITELFGTYPNMRKLCLPPGELGRVPKRALEVLTKHNITVEYTLRREMKKQRLQQPNFSLGAEMPPSSLPEHRIREWQTIRDIQKNYPERFEKLSDLERIIITLLYFSPFRFTNQEIGRELDIDDRDVSKIKKKAIKKLTDPQMEDTFS